ncbi:MAG: LysM peptidoglycan-binding domain-containing protein [Oscillospiraceae bacterium]|nr:LysM peptidoglycan-binding domain-containing protein [Oscillospiraceae bacterium]
MKFTKRLLAAAIAALLSTALIPVAAAKDAAASQTYTVQSGDSLWSISRKFATTIDELRRLNKLASDLILAGAILKVSEPASPDGGLYVNYVIQRGDTLGKIAEAYGTKIEFIRSLNGISGDLIYAGATIKVPARAGTPPTPFPPAPAAPSKTYSTYTVKSGDTVWSVSLQFGIPMQELLSDNGLNTSSVLNLGQKLHAAVYTIPVKPTPGAKFGEYLDWWTEAQYVVPINRVVKITDFSTGKSFTIKRTVGAGHADCEPLTSSDTAAAKAVFGGYTWNTRAVIAEVSGRKIAASMSFYPHDISYIMNNGFDGHFDLYFANCIRHADGKPDPNHQKMVEKAAGR